jgi:hypothetical protein
MLRILPWATNSFSSILGSLLGGATELQLAKKINKIESLSQLVTIPSLHPYPYLFYVILDLKLELLGAWHL